VAEPDMHETAAERTEDAFGPIDYQLGSVWPHDNAFVAGMHRCGFADEANRVFTAVVEAAQRFEHFRLPEVFAGYDRASGEAPVKCRSPAIPRPGRPARSRTCSSACSDSVPTASSGGWSSTGRPCPAS
jgi:hypothetical protein